MNLSRDGSFPRQRFIPFVGAEGRRTAPFATLAKIISGLYLPDTGGVSVSGILLSDATIQNVREEIYYMPQNEALFPGTYQTS
jgi:ABC-type transport system involved in cytochrome bd biosynthesis fused ATPase/permease subunit